ncbi:MAG: type IV pilus twitching motility protein PilT [Lachnospiraceae bacterium]|nr:type IV pilus twitching motility protein PilT [Lachnospiraceae bacterium]
MELKMMDVLTAAIEKGASDVYVVAGGPLAIKINGEIVNFTQEKLTHMDTSKLVHEIYALYEDSDIKKLQEKGDDDFSFSLSGLGRFRCNVYKQRGSYAAVLRVVKFDLPDFTALGIPESVINLGNINKGLILVTGPTGSGKSTTLASMIDEINEKQTKHIITIEDPIEFIHRHKKSIVSQREVQNDTESFATALRAALRQSPDVILMGEMRDYDTIQTVITAAETGQLVFSTLHTIGAAKTIDRIIDVFPPGQQQQIRIQLSMVLQAVVSQQLIPSTDGGLVPAFEIMVCNSAIRNMIRESKVFQMDNVIYSGAADGMRTMDGDILRLYNEGKISAENALLYSVNKDIMSKKLSM